MKINILAICLLAVSYPLNSFAQLTPFPESGDTNAARDIRHPDPRDIRNPPPVEGHQGIDSALKGKSDADTNQDAQEIPENGSVVRGNTTITKGETKGESSFRTGTENGANKGATNNGGGSVGTGESGKSSGGAGIGGSTGGGAGAAGGGGAAGAGR